MSDDEKRERERECAGWRKRVYEVAGEREREVGDCFTNRIPLINHPV